MTAIGAGDASKVYALLDERQKVAYSEAAIGRCGWLGFWDPAVWAKYNGNKPVPTQPFEVTINGDNNSVKTAADELVAIGKQQVTGVPIKYAGNNYSALKFTKVKGNYWLVMATSDIASCPPDKG